MSQESLTSCPLRRCYSQQLKTELVARCLNRVVSIASLAVEQGMNPNVLRRWMQEQRLYGRHTLHDVALPDAYQRARELLCHVAPELIAQFEAILAAGVKGLKLQFITAR